jgi:putative addiction module component (TIGR02574 family)
MSMTLREQIAALSIDEKILLIQDVLEDIRHEFHNEPVPDWLKEELDRRAAEHEADPSSALGLEETMAELRTKNAR